MCMFTESTLMEYREVPRIAYYNWKVREAFMAAGRKALRGPVCTSVPVYVGDVYYGRVYRSIGRTLRVLLGAQVITDRVQLPFPVPTYPMNAVDRNAVLDWSTQE